MSPIRVVKGGTQGTNAVPVESQAAAPVARKGGGVDWKHYGIGAANAFISATTGSLGSGLGAVAVGVGLRKSLEIAAMTALLSGLVSFFKWVNQHPLPGAEQ